MGVEKPPEKTIDSQKRGLIKPLICNMKMENTKSKLKLLGILILVIIGATLIANLFGLFKGDVVDKTIKEITIPGDIISIKIMGANDGIRLKTYTENGTTKTENFPIGNYIFRTECATISIDENLKYDVTNVSEKIYDKGGIGSGTSSSFFSKRIEIEIGDPSLQLLRANQKFKEITGGKEWYAVQTSSSSGDSLFGFGSFSVVQIWFVVDDKTLYMADIDSEIDEVKSIDKVKDVSGMSRDEIDEIANPDIKEMKEECKKMVRIVEADDEFKMLIDGKQWQRPEIYCGNGEFETLSLDLDNRSYFIVVDMVGERVLVIKDVTDAQQKWGTERQTLPPADRPITDEEAEELKKRWMEEENKILQIALADGRVREIIDGNRYFVGGQGSTGGPGYEIRTMDVSVGGIAGIFGTKYVICIDYGEEKVLAVTKAR